MKKLISSRELKNLMSGRWNDFFLKYPGFEVLIGKIGRHGPCPLTGGKDRFRLFPDFNSTGGAVSNQDGTFRTGVDLLAWYLQGGGVSQDSLSSSAIKEALSTIQDYVDPNGYDNLIKKPQPSVVISTEKRDLKKAKQNLKRLYRESQKSRKGGLVDKYLLSRGIVLNKIPQALREVSEMVYFDPEKNGSNRFSKHPGMIALFKEGEEAVCLHRVYLKKEGGKADVPVPKKNMTPAREVLSGAAIQLFNPFKKNEITYVSFAEGVETSLAIHALVGVPIWATTTAGLLERVTPPEGLTHADIWIDNDSNKGNRGKEAAKILKERLEKLGVKVRIIEPVTPGDDWNDVLIKAQKGEDFSSIENLPSKLKAKAFNKLKSF